MRSQQRAIAMTLIVAFYLTLVGPRASIMLQSGRGDARTIGAAIFLVPVVGAWLVWREGRFGRAVERLAEELGPSDVMTPDELAYVRHADPRRFDLAFAARRLEVEAAPHDWAAWYRLGVAYDAAGDRKNGRAALRRAVTLRAAAPQPRH